MTSPAYLARLNAPTAWTRQFGPAVSDFNRSPGRTVVSWGYGDGGALLTVRLSGGSGTPSGVLEAGKALVLRLETDQRLVGSHFFQVDPGVVVSTSEQSLRGGHDTTADFVIVLEGFDAASLREAWEEHLPALAPLHLDIEVAEYTCAHIVGSRSGAPT